MGDFVIRVHAVGGHGHNREIGDKGDVQARCQYPDNCTDCATNEFVEKLKKIASVKSAVLTHWPAEVEGYSGVDQVTDNLLNGKRRGSF